MMIGIKVRIRHKDPRINAVRYFSPDLFFRDTTLSLLFPVIYTTNYNTSVLKIKVFF